MEINRAKLNRFFARLPLPWDLPRCKCDGSAYVPPKHQSISNAKLCLDCDGVYQSGYSGDCPYCGSTATHWLSSWVEPLGGIGIKRAATGDRPYKPERDGAGVGATPCGCPNELAAACADQS